MGTGYVAVLQIASQHLLAPNATAIPSVGLRSSGRSGFITRSGAVGRDVPGLTALVALDAVSMRERGQPVMLTVRPCSCGQSLEM